MKVNKTMAPKKKKTSQSQKEVCPVEVVDFKINIESIETILQQIHAISSIDTHSVFFIKFRKLLEKYTIIDNNLNNNNVIKIIVTAEDKSVSTYSITVSKEKSINYLLITVLIETVVILGIILFLVLRKKNSDVNEEV